MCTHIQPRESKPSIKEKYTVRIPTEGQVATVSVELDIPGGVTAIDVAPPEGAKHEVEFLFTARNPAGEQITWNVRQNFADGKSTPWTPGTNW